MLIGTAADRVPFRQAGMVVVIVSRAVGGKWTVGGRWTVDGSRKC